jgi:integrase
MNNYRPTTLSTGDWYIDDAAIRLLHRAAQREFDDEDARMYQRAITLLRYADIRPGEILAARVEDFDIDEETLAIRHTVRFGQLTTAKRVRTISLDRRSLDAIAGLVAESDRWLLWAGEEHAPDPLTESEFSQDFDDIAVAASMPDLRLQHLRKSFVRDEFARVLAA